ncbi:SPFH domain-containing protein [Hymenobacter sp. CRA2]|uniref:SPFH domain-containing protein n=1 Tax=Hymenobacter sp. CRA2 TaxID=1955620 RepID=UPI00098F28B9|nr:SPFH domain-containing protein [Hymenobacter sp. CRA2]OON68976.1 virion core protein (lumpy skin disease virus) [Hymenobacter sp. CRA2]
MSLFNDLLFGQKREGGWLDVIRCDEPDYLVWKWRPAGTEGATHKENALRFGSSLRVKDGELAVFVYPQNDGTQQDYILGPQDRMIRTLNLPVLSELLGGAYGGDSPFQAEVYFINLAGNNQLRFGIPEFDLFDPRFPDLGVPCTVRGSLTFNLTNYQQFIKLNRLVNFSLEDFNEQIRSAFTRKAKSVVANVPIEQGLPVLQIERKLDELCALLQERLRPVLEDDFGVNLKRVDIGAIELDKAHPHYQQLKLTTADQQTKLAQAQTDIGIVNLAENARIQRKDTELQVEGRNFPVHQLDLQASVLHAAADNLGQMSQLGDGGYSAAGLMTGVAVGGLVGQQMGGMFGSLGRIPAMPPPPPAGPLYHLALRGQTLGTFTLEQLRQMALNGTLTTNHHVWREGFAAWELAGQSADLVPVFAEVPPPPPAPPQP